MLERQESTRSNCSSLKSSTSQLKKKIEELSLQKQPGEWQKEQEYDFRRNRRKLLEKQVKQEISKSRLKQVRFLFIPAGLGILCGTVMLFGSTIRSIGEGSVFWMNRKYFSIIGPVVLVIGLIFFFLAEGLQNHLTRKLRERGIFELKQEIHPDFHITNRHRRRTVSAHSSENEKFLSTKGESFLSSSLTSSSTLPDFAARWVRAMTLNIQDETVKHNGTSKLPERSVSFESDDSVDSGLMRSLNNAPQVDITDTDANTNITVVHVNGALNTLNKPTSNIPNGKHKTLVRMERVDSDYINGDCGTSLLRNESSKSFQGFYLEGISEESSAEIHIENI